MASETVRSLILPALGTLGTGFVAIVSIVDVGTARARYKVKAPATEPSPDTSEEDKQAWARAYRQYMNLIEWTAISQPIFWVSALVTREAFGPNSKPFKAVTYASAIWPIARLGYGKAYQKSAEARGSYFGIQSLCVLTALLVGAVSAGKIARQEFSKK
mmetsp:Transcript_66047/g.59312  ORF Transcript_66047/g.59312 Transcript_66047/m.59312 type:complete len:159 (+) Transcript_66047:32-508(+)